MRTCGSMLVAVLTVASGVVGAQALRVTIDIKPGDDPTTIETDRGGLLPVAILTTAQFDATTVDPGTVHIGPTGTEADVFRSMKDDVNRDGKPDLMILIRLQDMRAKCGDTVIKLTGKTRSGVDIEGSEAVTMEGCPN